jgi:hypothetical protein
VRSITRRPVIAPLAAELMESTFARWDSVKSDPQS